MEELNNFSILDISKLQEREYLLTCNINEETRFITVRVEMEEPVFGVNFSDNFMLTLRNYPQTSRRLIRIVKDLHHGEKVDFPVMLLVENKIPELQPA